MTIELNLLFWSLAQDIGTEGEMEVDEMTSMLDAMESSSVWWWKKESFGGWVSVSNPKGSEFNPNSLSAGLHEQET